MYVQTMSFHVYTCCCLRYALTSHRHPRNQAHLHLWNFEYWNQPEAPTYGFLGHDGTLAAYKRRVEALFGQREVSGLMLPFPIKGLESETAMSTWAAEQCRSNTGSGLFAPSLLITPATTYDEIVTVVQSFGFVNLKP